MAKRILLALAAAAGLLCSTAPSARAAIAINDNVSARLVQGPNGTYRVMFNFSRLTANDTIRTPIRRAELSYTGPRSAGIRFAQFEGGRRNVLQQRVIVTLTNNFARAVLAGRANLTGFSYRITDSCRTRSCGLGASRAFVSLNVLSPN